jgi:hypothetical protein
MATGNITINIKLTISPTLKLQLWYLRAKCFIFKYNHVEVIRVRKIAFKTWFIVTGVKARLSKDKN